MIYLLLFFEFFKIGLFAIGGGLVTVPFLFDLSKAYGWFTAKELTDMIAVAESTPGPIGVNMATYAGFNAAGILGGLIATLGLVTPSVIVIVAICRLMNKYRCNRRVNTMLEGVRPAVIALILFAGLELAKISLADLTHGLIFAIMFASIRFYKKSPVFYLGLSAVIGIVLKL